MTVLIVEYIPYVAFTAAAGLVAWVSFDVLRARFARPRVLAPDAAQDSGRGLAGPAIPLSARAPLVAEVVPEAEPVVVAEIEPEPAVEAAVEPELPVSQAVNVAEEPAEEAAEEPAAEVAEELPIAVEADVITVRRDPSVRVFDTAVAASERKVLSTGD
jgi:hypothetical protein